ncbi:MAG: ATP synthase F0 subunit B, partial [Planctomycetota bacterium]
LLDDTKKQVEAEFVEARRRLQREAAQLAVSIARKILEREVDEKKHHDLVARFIKETGGDTQ